MQYMRYYWLYNYYENENYAPFSKTDLGLSDLDVKILAAAVLSDIPICPFSSFKQQNSNYTTIRRHIASLCNKGMIKRISDSRNVKNATRSEYVVEFSGFISIIKKWVEDYASWESDHFLNFQGEDEDGNYSSNIKGYYNLEKDLERAILLHTEHKLWINFPFRLMNEIFQEYSDEYFSTKYSQYVRSLKYSRTSNYPKTPVELINNFVIAQILKTCYYIDLSKKKQQDYSERALITNICFNIVNYQTNNSILEEFQSLFNRLLEKQEDICISVSNLIKREVKSADALLIHYKKMFGNELLSQMVNDSDFKNN